MLKTGLGLTVVAVLSTGCSAESQPRTDTAPASPSSSASPAAASASPAQPSPAAATTPSAPKVLPGGVKVKGTGYTVQLAKGFVAAPEADAASRAEGSHVRRQTNGAVQLFGVAVHPGAVSPEGAAKAVAQTATKNGATDVRILPATTLDGKPAIPISERRVMQGIRFVMREYVVFDGDVGYQVYFSSSRVADDTALMRIYTPMLDTWRWNQSTS